MMLALPVLALSVLAAPAPKPTHATPRVVVFFERGFPAVDAETPTEAGLVQAAGDGAVLATSDELAAKLEAAGPTGTFVNPYGSAFPKRAWPAILAFLRGGGSWVNLGGVPFEVPVAREGTAWRQEQRQVQYHHELGILQGFRVPASRIAGYVALDPTVARLADALRPQDAFGLHVRFTSTTEAASEWGAGGTRDGAIAPLVHALSADKHPVAAPIVRIDRFHGSGAGGRWILATTAAPPLSTLAGLVAIAADGAVSLRVRPSLACYRAGERPTVAVSLRRPRAGDKAAQETVTIELLDDADRVLSRATAALTGSAALVESGDVVLPDAPTRPGLYRVRATVRSSAATIADTNGFWIFDPELLAGGKRLTADAHILRRDGAPFPVVGSTYMASDVQRRFLDEPNPAVWDRDLAAMKAAGVNLIRSGLWTGWRRLMLDPDVPHEGMLRALDAFLLTARRHDIPVIFTLFAFLPESWNGANPFLDPRARAAQQEFASVLARRYRTMNDLVWDLINEPSFSSPGAIWQCRPNYDGYEAAAWRAWLRRTQHVASDAELEARMQERWRIAGGDVLRLPPGDDFGEPIVHEGKSQLRGFSYRLFAQDAFEDWARGLRSALGAAAPGHLVTVGQDEGGTGDRPSPLFHGRAMDFTCAHTWWNTDDLLWDQVMAAYPGKPTMVEETGVMMQERPDGTAYRSEDEARALLARKLAFAVDGAGSIQWLWHTNPDMTSDNEAAIGLLRADGSEKPETEAFRAAAAFVSRHAEGFDGRSDEDVVMVVPHSSQFAAHNFAGPATRRCVRVMAYACRTPLRAVSEYRLDDLGPARLIVLPSARVLSDDAWQKLLKAVDGGVTLLVTGPIDADEYWRPVPRLRDLGVGAGSRSVARGESVQVGGASYELSYAGDALEHVERGDAADGAVTLVRHGRGTIVWSPLPVELAQESEPTAALYRFALKTAGLEPPVTGDIPASVLVRPTFFKDAVLYTIVSEAGRDVEVAWTHRETGTPLHVTARAQHPTLLWVDRKTGRVADETTF